MDEIKYKGRFRIPSSRAWWHQYQGGTYFVTICTKNKEHYFGEIEENVMRMTEVGIALNEQILLTSTLRADMNVEIPLYVIMPNHVHLIVVIGQNRFNSIMGDCNGRGRAQHVSTEGNKFSPQSKNLASVIRGIKTATTSFALKNGFDFAWQSRYHEHIVRNIDELNWIALYIEHNVSNWKQDRFHG